MGKRRARVRFVQYIGNPRGNTPASLVGKVCVVTFAEQRGDKVFLCVGYPDKGKATNAAVLEENEWELVSGVIEPAVNGYSAPYVPHKRGQQVRMDKAMRAYGKRVRRGAKTVRY